MQLKEPGMGILFQKVLGKIKLFLRLATSTLLNKMWYLVQEQLLEL
jgi:hypothetical protein